MTSTIVELQLKLANYFITDEGYDSEAIRNKAHMHSMIPVIPKRANAKQSNPELDSYLYKLRSF